MADSDIQITAGSGTKVDTRTVGAGADEHRQVMVIGDPATAANVASVDVTNGLDVDVTRVKPDGTNTMPSLDAAARAGFIKITDGTNTAPVDATYGLEVDVSRIQGQVVVGDGTNAAFLDVNAVDGRSAASNLLSVAGRQFIFNGTSWDRARGDTTNGLDVDVTRIDPGTGPTNLGKAEDAAHVNGDTGVMSLGVILNTPSGTTNDYAPFSIHNTTGGMLVSGDVGHNTADAGYPVKIGGKAIAHGTNPTAVAAASRTDIYTNRAGVPFVMGGHPNIQTVRLQFTAAQTDVAIVTVAAGLKIVVTALQVTVDSASTGFPLVRIGFGAANTPTTTGVIAAHGGVPAGGGFTRGDGSGILGVGADGDDLRITTVTAATGNGVEVVVTYYTIES